MTVFKYKKNNIKIDLRVDSKPSSIKVSGQVYPFLSTFNSIRFDCQIIMRRNQEIRPDFEISLNGTHSENDLVRYMNALQVAHGEIAELKGRIIELYNPDNAASLIEKSLNDNGTCGLEESLLLISLCSTLNAELFPTHSVNFRKGEDSSPTVLDHVLRSDAFKSIILKGNLILGKWKGLESGNMLEDNLEPDLKAAFEIIMAIIDKTKFKYSGDDEPFVDNINNNYEFLELALHQITLSTSNKIPFTKSFE